VTKISELPFIASVNDHGAGEKATIGNVVFNENDDIELCLYYLRSLQHVLRCTGEVTRAVLASKYLYFGGGEVHLRGMLSLLF